MASGGKLVVVVCCCCCCDGKRIFYQDEKVKTQTGITVVVCRDNSWKERILINLKRKRMGRLVTLELSRDLRRKLNRFFHQGCTLIGIKCFPEISFSYFNWIFIISFLESCRTYIEFQLPRLYPFLRVLLRQQRNRPIWETGTAEQSAAVRPTFSSESFFSVNNSNQIPTIESV